jgi:hypothetical protein
LAGEVTVQGDIIQTLPQFTQDLSGQTIVTSSGDIIQDLIKFEQAVDGQVIVQGDIVQIVNPFEQALSGTGVTGLTKSFQIVDEWLGTIIGTGEVGIGSGGELTGADPIPYSFLSDIVSNSIENIDWSGGIATSDQLINVSWRGNLTVGGGLIHDHTGSLITPGKIPLSWLQGIQGQTLIIPDEWLGGIGIGDVGDEGQIIPISWLLTVYPTVISTHEIPISWLGITPIEPHCLWIVESRARMWYFDERARLWIPEERGRLWLFDRRCELNT